MSAVTQTIPNYIFGISQQPDQLKQPGQLRDSINVTPDVIAGLVKRPGSRFIGQVNDNVNGKWFNYYRSEAEQYIGHIQPNGWVSVVNAASGVIGTVTQLPGVTFDSRTDNYLWNQQIGLVITAQAGGYTAGTATNVGTTNINPSVAPMGTGLEVSTAVDANGDLTAVQVWTAGQGYIPGDTVSIDGLAGTVITIIDATQVDNLQLMTINDYSLVTNRAMAPVNGTAEHMRQPILEGGPIDRTDPPVRDLAGIRILYPDTNNAAGTTFDQATEITQFNSPDDRFTIPDNNLRVDVKVEEWDFIDEDGTQTQRREVTGINFASTVALTDGGAGIEFPNGDVDGDFTDQRCVFTGDFEGSGEGFTVSGTLAGGVVTDVAIDNPGQFTWMGTSTFEIIFDEGWTAPEATLPQCTHTETAGARGEFYQNGDVFWVTSQEGANDGRDGPIFQIIDKAYATPYQPSAIVNLKVLAYGREYRIDVANDEGEPVFGVIVDTTASADTQIGAVKSVLEPLRERIIEAREDPGSPISATNPVYGFGCQIIGNSLYIVFNQDFNITVSDAQLMECFTDEVNNIERLPFQCKNGYVVKVTNTAQSEDDDFYVEFEGHLNQDGEGAWAECAQPDIQKKLYPATMPHQIVSTALDTFVVQEGTFTDREVGDEDTNPTPSFVDNEVINNIVLFRNRIVYLSGEDVVATTAGGLSPQDFWSASALSVLAVDPLDLSAASKKPAILWDAIEINNGLLLFANTQQYLLTTDSDLLSNETAKISVVAYYQYNKQVSPFSMGVTVGFTDVSGRNFRFFEMSNLLREGEPTVTEISQIVGQLTDRSVRWVADSKEGKIILFASNPDEPDAETMWGYRYFQDGDQRKQSAWFKWKLPGPVIFHTIMQDVYYAVCRYESSAGVFQNQLIEIDLKRTDDSAILTLPAGMFRIHMDHKYEMDDQARWNITYDETTDRTFFDMPTANTDPALILFNRTIYAYQLAAGGPQLGTLREVIWNAQGDRGSVPGNWVQLDANGDIIPFQIGYLIDMKIDIPEFFVTERAGDSTRSDVRSWLNIQRFQLSTGATGLYDVNLDILGKDDRTINVIANRLNNITVGSLPLEPEWTQYIPVYERSRNVDISISTTHPSPFVLYSLAWEGDYTKRWYQGV
tara:strand:- start:7415 stop:10849 length:3435 start_codon:yes stop_codon:yes gene_type:complete